MAAEQVGAGLHLAVLERLIELERDRCEELAHAAAHFACRRSQCWNMRTLAAATPPDFYRWRLRSPG
jgi:hypothetical protein